MSNIIRAPTAPPNLPGWNGQQLQAAFAQASKTKPWTLAYRSFSSEQASCNATVSGRFPDSLRGDFYRIGPGRHELGGLRYGHRWDGDGLLQRFTIGPDGVQHLARYVQTQKYRDETEANRLLHNTFGTAVTAMPPTAEAIERSNPANISVLPMGGELLALWEAGSPYRIEPRTLETLGRPHWAEGPAITRPFSAHPKFGPDGTLWSFGIEPMANRLTLYRFTAGATAPTTSSLQIEDLAPVHDFAVTERHAVLLLPSIVFDRERLMAGASFAHACRWAPEHGMRVLVIGLADSTLREYRTEAGYLYHVANAWDDRGTIHVDYMRAADPVALMAGWSVMAGQYRHRQGASLTRLSIDTAAGRTSQRALAQHDAEFPVVAPKDAGTNYRHVLCVERSEDRPADLPGYDRLSLLDVESGERQSHLFNADWMLEEHVIVADPTTGTPRWIVGTGLDLSRARTSLMAFDYANIDRGPIAQASLDYAMPLGLHGAYVAANG